MTPSLSRSSPSRLTLSALMVVLALIFTYVEVLIPYPAPVPGVKLGLANLVMIIALYRLDLRYAFTINMIRVVLSGLLFTGLFAMMYSLAGGILSVLFMWALKRTSLFSMIGVSMAGGVAHNLGQTMVAAVMISSAGIFAYFPILVFTGIIAGILIGIIAYTIDKRLPESIFS